MKLIDLLVQELPKRGGWPVKAKHAWCDRDGEIRFRGDAARSDFYPKSGTVDYEKRIPNASHEDDHDFIITREQYGDALAASKQPAWDGEGIPPEGIECEVKSGKDSWTLCRVVHSSSASVEFIYLEEPSPESASRYLGVIDCVSINAADSYFRATRTEEERKRDQAIKQMMDCSAVMVEATAGLIYDAIAAGKIPGIRLE